jgi:hypothetical protein
MNALAADGEFRSAKVFACAGAATFSRNCAQHPRRGITDEIRRLHRVLRLFALFEVNECN